MPCIHVHPSSDIRSTTLGLFEIQMYFCFVMGSKQRIKEVKETINYLLIATEVAKEKLRRHYLKMPKPEMLEEFRQYESTDLEWIYENLGLTTDDYEICRASYEVLQERGLK